MCARDTLRRCDVELTCSSLIITLVEYYITRHHTGTEKPQWVSVERVPKLHSGLVKLKCRSVDDRVRLVDVHCHFRVPGLIQHSLAHQRRQIPEHVNQSRLHAATEQRKYRCTQ